jgi:hypothetical protein
MTQTIGRRRTRRPIRVSLPAVVLGALALGACRPVHRSAIDSSLTAEHVRRLWLSYLDSKNGHFSREAATPSPLWDSAERQRWQLYDLAGFYLPDNATYDVIAVQRASSGSGEYQIRTLFTTPNENNPLRARRIWVTSYATRVDTSWMLANALLRSTAGWRRERIGPFTYVVQPGVEFRRERAMRAATFADSAADAFEVPRLTEITYYLTRSVDDVYRIMGLETERVWGPVGGVAQPVNRQIFSGMPSVGEEYRHEIAHMVLLPLIGSTTYFVSEGVPTWLGGTTGMDLRRASRELARFLSEHRAATLDSLIGGGHPPALLYPAAGIFVDLVFRARGVAGVKSLFAAGPGTAQFRASVERLLQRSWSEISDEWRRRAIALGSTQ